MKDIVANIVKGRTLSYLLAAGLTFAGAETAQAAERYWKGGGSDTLWSTAANWKDNAAPASGDKVHFRADQVSGGFSGKTVTIRNAYTAGLLHVSNGSNAEGPIVFNADEDSSHGVTFTDDGWLGYYEQGALWLKSGTYTFAKSLRVGVDVNGDGSYKGYKYSFWLKVGDGSSTAVLNAKGIYGPIIGKASKLIADKATLDFTGKNFLMYSESGAYITNSTMTANAIVLENKSSMTVSNSTITATGDHTIFKETSKLIADNSTLNFTGKNFNMYGTSSASIKDSETTAKLLNLAIGDNSDDNCKAVFNGGSLTLSETSLIGYGRNAKGYLYATNLTLKITGDSPHLHLGGQSSGRTGATGVVDKNGGDWEIGGDLVIGAQGSSTGTFTTDGGSVTVGGDTYIAKGSGSTGTLTIKNGTFTTKGISAIGTATLNIDGGTLKAGANNANLINSGIAVKVGARGATIDTVGRAVTIASAVGNADGATGAMTFAGGGSVTLSGAANWTGGTTVSNSTTLALGSDVSLAGNLSLLPGATLSSSSVSIANGRTVEVAASGTANFNSDLVLDNATLGFNFTEKSIAPVLAIESGKKASGTVKVKVSAAGGIRPKGGTYTLSSGGGFTDVNVSFDNNDKPEWVAGISVNGDGNIVLTVKPMGFMVLVT